MAENIFENLGIAANATTDISAEETKNVDNSAENTLATIATIVLIFGLITTIVCLFTLTSIKVGYHNEFNPIGFAYTIMILFTTLISWSVMKVLSNISLTLKDLNNKIKKEPQETASEIQSTNVAHPTEKSRDQHISELKTYLETGAISQEEYDELSQK